MKIRKGDTVKLIVGKDRGKSGLVEGVFLAEDKVVVKGIHLQKKHVKPSKQNPSGGIIEKNKKIDVSSVMLVCPSCGKAIRVGYKISQDSKIRICKKCGRSVESGKVESK